MENTFRIHLAAIAAVSLIALTGCDHGRSASPDASSGEVRGFPAPLGTGHQPLSAGVHVLDLVSRERPGTGPARLPRIAVTLPSGWFNNDGWAMNDGGTLNMGFWNVDKVYTTPCRWQRRPMIDPGRTVDGLASVLTNRPLRNASTPTDVTLAGMHGKYLSWSVPANIHLAKCDQGYFESWTASGWSTDRWQQGPGQVDRIWILDVQGQRLVIDAGYMPSATTAERGELNRIVHSIRILNPTVGNTSSASAVTGAVQRSGRHTIQTASGSPTRLLMRATRGTRTTASTAVMYSAQVPLRDRGMVAGRSQAPGHE